MFNKTTLCLLFLVGCQESTGKPLDHLPELKTYTSWPKAHPTRISMSPMLAVLCALPSPAEAKKRVGPHTATYQVFVNPKGASAFLNLNTTAFPEGTVVVKEKFEPPHATKPSLLTIMIKQQRGFDPKHGDWEFVVTDGKGIRQVAEVASCQSCHASVAARGYVFRNYVKLNAKL